MTFRVFDTGGGDYRLWGADAKNAYYTGSAALVGGFLRMNIMFMTDDGSGLTPYLLVAKLNPSTLSGTYVRKELVYNNHDFRGSFNFVKCP